MDTNKLKGRDLITIAIFSLLFMLIYFACAIPTGLLVFVYPFCVAIAMIPCGIVWTYMRVKVPKRFAIIVQSVIFTILVFLLGSGWFVALGVFIGGILAELLSAAGKYKSFKWNIAGYATFAVFLNLGLFAIILLARDYYYDFSVKSGMETGYMDTLIGFVSGPLLLLSCAFAAAGALIGLIVGKLFLKKHFERAGIV